MSGDDLFILSLVGIFFAVLLWDWLREKDSCRRYQMEHVRNGFDVLSASQQ